MGVRGAVARPQAAGAGTRASTSTIRSAACPSHLSGTRLGRDSPWANHASWVASGNAVAMGNWQAFLPSVKKDCKAALDLVDEFLAKATEQRPEATVEAELLAMLPDEVQHGAHGLPGAPA